MAEEAFALSPISARAAQPSEADYAAISEAFMETSRGRWFLSEYARRNRNADTSMVLDAVARIEESLAAQRHAAEADNGLIEATLAEARLAEVLAAIRDAVDAAQATATEALDRFALDQKLVPVRKGARVIREIAWRLREIGNDGRICDLIDSQVEIIEAGAAQISSDEAMAALSAGFAALAERLAEFSSDQAAAPVTEADPVAEAPVAIAEPVFAHAPPVMDLTATDVTPAPEPSEGPTAAAVIEEEAAEVGEIPDEAAADAHDEAVLDMIAMEMGAPEPFEIDDTADVISEAANVAEMAQAEPEIVAEAPEPLAAPMPPPAPHAVIESPAESPMEVSLGSTIIASGMLRKPGLAANDPLAPIRRMSQAEKIAFFS